MSRMPRRSLALRRAGLATALLLVLSGCTPGLVPKDQATLDNGAKINDKDSWNG